MSWLESWERRAREAIGVAVDPAEPAPRVIQPPRPKPEIKTVLVQTAPPLNGDTGVVELGFYSFVDGVVTMHDDHGKPTGKCQLLISGEDPHRVAWLLTRDAWQARTPDFNRRLDYLRDMR